MAQKALKNLATCRTCHHQAPTMEFFMPDVFCSQACYDKSRPSGHRHESTTTGKRKKKRATYLECYEQDYSLLEMNTANKRRDRSSASNSKQFNYNQFILDEDLIETPNNIFSYETDTVENGFQVDMKLEGIDPLHPSLYCVLTVTEVKGLRIRVRFDGYGDLYDFWTYCYCDEIFPAGWCNENNKKICPPKSWKSEAPFSWSTYKQQTKCETAPSSLFTVCSPEYLSKKSSFRINDKLEAADIKNNMLVCVASVADTYADNMLIHFDGWEDAYDYWCKSVSPNIHPVGWCLANRQVLSAPNGYPDATNFKWETYFTETNSRAAPASQFGQSKENKFEVGMVVEIVDRRNPGLIRVAQITSSIGNRIKIHFSGWDDKYDYWIEQDSYDLHPPGYCEKTGHPLTPPLTPLDIAIQRGSCPTPGCSGVGHVKHSKYTCHSSNVGCPYSDCSLKKDSPIPDRFVGIEHILTQYSSIDNVKTVYHQPLLSPNQLNKSQLNSPSSTVKKRPSNSHHSELAPPTKISTHQSKSVLSNIGIHRNDPVLVPVTSQTNSKPTPTTLDIEIYKSVFLSELPTKSKENGRLPTVTANIIKTLLIGYQEPSYDEAISWSPDQVIKFLHQIVPSLTAHQISKFMEQSIDGEALLLLEQSDIISYLGLKLGPALKIFNSIKLIKSQKHKHTLPS